MAYIDDGESVWTDDLKGLGERIRRCRDVLGWSQEHLARKLRERGLEFTRESVSQYENGNVNVPYINLLELSRALRVPVPMLTGEQSIVSALIALNQDDVTDDDREDALAAAEAILEQRRKRRRTNPDE